MPRQSHQDEQQFRYNVGARLAKMTSITAREAMKPEDHLEFLAPDEIRIRGTRIGLENVLYQLIDCACTPEALVEQFPSLTLEQVYASVEYYQQHRQEVEQYLAEWRSQTERLEAEQDLNPSPGIARLRKRKTDHIQAKRAVETK